MGLTAEETTAALPVYIRIKEYLKHGLSVGQWSPGDRMPSESALMERFQVSRMTVNRALRELQAEGHVEGVRGIGTFAAHPQLRSSTLTIRDIREEVLSRGHRYRAQVVFVLSEQATTHIAKRLGLREHDLVYHSMVIHYDDDIPIELEDRFVSPLAVPHYVRVDFTVKTPTEYLLAVAPTWEAEYTIEAAMPTQKEASLLKLDPCDSCLILTRWTKSRGIPVTWVRLVHPGAIYQLVGQFRP